MGYRIRIDEPGDHPRVVDVTDPVEVGRQVDGLRLFDPTVSRRHLQLEARPEGLVVTDLGSSYGSYVHGYRLAGPVLLQVGDIVQVGNSRLTVLGPVEDGAREPVAAVHASATGEIRLGPPEGAAPPVSADPSPVLDATIAGSIAGAPGLTPPPPTGVALTPPPPGAVEAPPAVPPSSTRFTPPAPPPPPSPAPLADAPGAPRRPAAPLAARPGAQLVVLNLATVLALAMPIGLLMTIGDALTDLEPDEVALRLILLGATLLVTLAGVLGVTTFRALLDGARNEDAEASAVSVPTDRRLVALGVLPAWCGALGLLAVLTDPMIGVLITFAMVGVLAVWLWASTHPLTPPSGARPPDPGAPAHPPVRQVAVAALTLLGLLVLVISGIALTGALDRNITMGAAVIELFLVAQAPLPLAGLLRP